MASLLVGIDSLVDYALQHGHSSYYLGGAKTLSKKVKAFVAKCAITSFVADAALGLLLTDDRLRAVLTALKAEVACEVEYIAGALADEH